MNKAKIILSALALFAVVGGALAFKANNFRPSQLFWYTTVNNVSYCTTSPYNSTIGIESTTTSVLFSTSSTSTYTTAVGGPTFTSTYCTGVHVDDIFLTNGL